MKTLYPFFVVFMCAVGLMSVSSVRASENRFGLREALALGKDKLMRAKNGNRIRNRFKNHSKRMVVAFAKECRRESLNDIGGRGNGDERAQRRASFRSRRRFDMVTTRQFEAMAEYESKKDRKISQAIKTQVKLKPKENLGISKTRRTSSRKRDRKTKRNTKRRTRIKMQV